MKERVGLYVENKMYNELKHLSYEYGVTIPYLFTLSYKLVDKKDLVSFLTMCKEKPGI